MEIKKYLRTVTLTTVLVAATVLAQTPYDEGQKALREQNWTVAAEQFKEAIKADKKHGRCLHVLAGSCALQSRAQKGSGTPGKDPGA